MKKLILFFILLIPIISALEFSPASLQFNLEKNQVSCKKINFEIESPATVRDTWAQSSLEEWSVTSFKTNSQEHGIELSYPSEINPEQKELEFCVSGYELGEYKGALIFRQEKIGNSIVQFAVWLKVNISGSETQNNNQDKSSSKSSKGGGGGSSITVYSNKQFVPLNAEKIPEEKESEEEKIILGEKISRTSSKESPVTLLFILGILPIIFIILLFVLLVFKRPKSLKNK